MPLSGPQNDAATIVIMSSLPVQLLLLAIAGWMTRDHQRVTAYLLAENAVLREHRGFARADAISCHCEAFV